MNSRKAQSCNYCILLYYSCQDITYFFGDTLGILLVSYVHYELFIKHFILHTYLIFKLDECIKKQRENNLNAFWFNRIERRIEGRYQGTSSVL